MKKNPWYRAARIFLAIFAVTAVLTAIAVFFMLGAPPESATQMVGSAPGGGGSGEGSGINAVIPLISVCTMFISALGTASTVLLGWRSERRQQIEFGMKVKQLEKQLAEAREAEKP